MEIQKTEKKQKLETIFAILCSFLMVCVALGFTSSTKSFFLKAITEALEIPRSLFAFNDTARYAVTAVLSVYFGTLIGKLGTKKLILIGFLLLMGSMSLYAVASHLPVFYLAGMLHGAGLSFVGSTMGSYIVKRRCKKHVGALQGLVMSANGLGGAFAAQWVTPIIESAPMGYRKAYWGIVAILGAVALLIMILFKEDKATPHAHSGKKARGQTWEGMTFAQAKKRPYFWMLCVCVLMTGYVLSGINGISNAHMRDVGIDAGFVANIFSAHSLLLMFFKFSTGALYDWKGLRFTILVSQIIGVIVLVALALASPTPFGVVMAATYSILSGGALTLETIGVTLIAGDVFGNKDFAKVLGVLHALNCVGLALGGPTMNFVFDIMKTYVPAIWFAVTVMVAVIVCFQFSVSAAQKEQRSMEQPEQPA